MVYVHQRIKVCESSSFPDDNRKIVCCRFETLLHRSCALRNKTCKKWCISRSEIRLRKYLAVGTFISIHRSELNFKWIIESQFYPN